MSTSVPLTVTGFESSITALLCTLPVFLDGAPNPLRARGFELKNSFEDKVQAIRLALAPLALRWWVTALLSAAGQERNL